MEKPNGKTDMLAGNSSGDASKEVSFHDYLAILYRSRWIILTVFLTVMAAVSYYTFTTAPTYEASATIMVDEKQGIGQSLFDVTGFSQQRTLINNQVEILKSRALHFAALQRMLESSVRDSLELFRDLGTEKTMADVYELLLESINITPIRDTDLIKINVQAQTPFETAYLANTLAESYRDMDQNLSRGEISQVVQFLEEQLKGKEKDLKGTEEKLKDYLEDEKIGSLSDEATQLVEKGAEFESIYEGALIDLEAAHKRLSHLKARLGKSRASLESELASVSNPLVLQLRREMAEIERTIALYLSQGVTERDPQVYQEKTKLDAIKVRLTEETRKIIMQGLPANDPLAHAQGLVVQILKLETQVTSLQARADGLGRVVENYTSRLEALPDKNIQLARLERNRQVNEKLYVMMREKFEESRITQAGQIGKVRILDHAVAPIVPVFPNKKLNLLVGFLLGMGLGIAIAFFREQLDTSVRRVEDIENLGLTLLAAIPRIDQSQIDGSLLDPVMKSELNGRDETNRLITHFKPKSPISEAYRTLRTNLQFSVGTGQLRNFLVTSAGPGEGKSTTTANLAIAMSLQGTKTVLVDTDLRRPVVHKIFSLDRNRGLTNVLVGNMTLAEVIQKTQIDNLDVITSGVLPPNPAELLGSRQMRDLLDELKEQYDMCLFDTPPLIAVTDAAVLSKELDGVLLVTKSGQTRRDALVRGVDLLRNVGTRILGVLLNDVSKENTYGSYYYNYQYYYYYGEGGNKKKVKRSRRKKVVRESSDEVNLTVVED